MRWKVCSVLFGKKFPFALLVVLAYWTSLDLIWKARLPAEIGGSSLFPPVQSKDAPMLLTNNSSNGGSDGGFVSSWIGHSPLPPPPPAAAAAAAAATYSHHKIQLRQDEAFFWTGRQRKYCKRLQKETTQLLRRQSSEQASNTTRLAATLRVPCHSLHQMQRHGNMALGIYAMHIGAMAHNADFIFLCKESSNHQYHNLFWWLQSFPDSLDRTRTLLWDGSRRQRYDPPQPSPSQACAGMGKHPFHYASELIQYDLRRMALALLGPRSITPTYHDYNYDYDSSPELASSRTNVMNTSSSQQQQPRHTFPSQPLYPNLELDSFAIHFRCGDVLSRLSSAANANYGLLPFYVYRSILLQQQEEETTTTTTTTNISTIGIVTAPFDPTLLRQEDSRHAVRCQFLVERLQSYLAQSFPQARVSIRNDPHDTIPMVYARLILADQLSVCIRSTFCVFPTLASVAQRRVLLEGGVSYFVSAMLNPSTNHNDNDNDTNHAKSSNDGLVLLEQENTPYLLSHEIHELGWNRTLEWVLASEAWHLENQKKKQQQQQQQQHRRRTTIPP